MVIFTKTVNMNDPLLAARLQSSGRKEGILPHILPCSCVPPSKLGLFLGNKVLRRGTAVGGVLCPHGGITSNNFPIHRNNIVIGKRLCVHLKHFVDFAMIR